MTARSASRHIGTAMTILLGAARLAYAVTDDRAYLLGDDPLEDASVGIAVGSGADNVAPGNTLDSQGPAGFSAFLDIQVNGGPLYANVNDRPDGNGGIGATFSGSGQFLSTPISMSSPSFMWNNPTFFPGTPFGLNYNTILAQGIQAWVKPADTGARQDVVMNTDQNGIFISAGDTWGLQFVGGATASSSSVAYGQWAHVMQLSGANDTQGGHSSAEGVLLVNGVAVAASGGEYGNSEGTLNIGGATGDVNMYSGTIDDVHVFLWGDNSFVPPDNGREGQSWGTLDLAVDNEWIAWQLDNMGVTDRGDVNLSGGAPNAADVTAFVAGYGTERVVNGIRVGDWTSRQEGDLNYDGIVDLKDAFILNDALIAGTGTGLDFSLLTSATGVPEPSTVVILLTTFIALAFAHRRRTAKGKLSAISRQLSAREARSSG